jgi:hypothetical protein
MFVLGNFFDLGKLIFCTWEEANGCTWKADFLHLEADFLHLEADFLHLEADFLHLGRKFFQLRRKFFALGKLIFFCTWKADILYYI